jgi:hypothetical protein
MFLFRSFYKTLIISYSGKQSYIWQIGTTESRHKKENKSYRGTLKKPNSFIIFL